MAGKTRETTTLTDNQLDYLHCVSLGMSNAAVGKRFNVCKATVSTQLVRAYEKLEVVDSAHAVLVACYSGLLGPDAMDYRYIDEYQRSREGKPDIKPRIR